jgi:hypothetical protein
MRLRLGLHWKQDTPTVSDYHDAIRSLVLLFVVLVAWAWAMNADYEDASTADRPILKCKVNANWNTSACRSEHLCYPTKKRTV